MSSPLRVTPNGPVNQRAMRASLRKADSPKDWQGQGRNVPLSEITYSPSSDTPHKIDLLAGLLSLLRCPLSWVLPKNVELFLSLSLYLSPVWIPAKSLSVLSRTHSPHSFSKVPRPLLPSQKTWLSLFFTVTLSLAINEITAVFSQTLTTQFSSSLLDSFLEILSLTLLKIDKMKSWFVSDKFGIQHGLSFKEVPLRTEQGGMFCLLTQVGACRWFKLPPVALGWDSFLEESVSRLCLSILPLLCKPFALVLRLPGKNKCLLPPLLQSSLFWMGT